MDGIYIVTPCMSGKCSVGYVKGMLEYSKLATERKLPTEYLFHQGGSHVCIARNHCVDGFLKSNWDAMLFVDDDIGFRGQYILDLYDSGLDLVGGTYARKHLDLESAFNCALQTKDFEAFKKAMYTYSARLDLTDKNIRYLPEKRVIEASHLPTGFLLIRRKVFETIAEAFPQYRFEGGQYNYFGYPESGIAFGEDYYFCDKATKAGIKLYMHAGMRLDHAGHHTYEGQSWV